MVLSDSALFSRVSRGMSMSWKGGLAAVSLLLVSGCSPQGRLSDDKAVQITNRHLSVTIDPVVACYNEVDTRTGMFVSFIGRDPDTRAPLKVEACQSVTGNDVLGEGGSGVSSLNLKSDLSLTLVIDASTSMVTSGVFEEVVDAAERLVRNAGVEWGERPGQFNWRFIWFNDVIFEPESTIAPNPQDLGLIEAPAVGATTRLYSAIDYGIDLSVEHRTRGPNIDNQNTDILIVFTDGRDNASERPIVASPELCPTGSGCKAIDPTVVDGPKTLVQRLGELPWLQVVTLALGDEPDKDALQSIAHATEEGRLIESDAVDTLFDQARREFVEKRAFGFYGPVSFGKAEWTLDFFANAGDATQQRRGVQASYTFDPSELPSCEGGFVDGVEANWISFETDQTGSACTYDEIPIDGPIGGDDSDG